MIVRVYITIGVLAALLVGGEIAMAGGMPSNEGPKVVIGGAELQKLVTPTISTFIEEDFSQHVGASPSDDSVIDPSAEFSLPSATLSRSEQYGVRPGGRDDREMTP